jgi:hypothetical protein
MDRDFNIHNWQAKYLRESRDLPVEDLVQKLLEDSQNPIDTVLNALFLAKRDNYDMDNLALALLTALKN